MTVFELTGLLFIEKEFIDFEWIELALNSVLSYFAVTCFSLIDFKGTKFIWTLRKESGLLSYSIDKLTVIECLGIARVIYSKISLELGNLCSFAF